MTQNATVPTLLSDLGGTNVRFALSGPGPDTPLQHDSLRRYQVRDFDSLADAIKQYFADTGLSADQALIAAAGRISDGETVQITNNPWAISTTKLEQALSFNSVRLVNDFAAQSMAVMLLKPADMVSVGNLPLPQFDVREEQTFVIVGPGTGLGVGALLLRQGECSVLQTEGGHAGFAAHTPEDIEILKRLNQRYGRVSNERLISGNGLVNLYCVLCELAGQTSEELKPEDISARANANSDPLCVQAMETFAGIFGSVAGDLVLTLGGWNGVYLTGGLVPVLLPWMERGHFRERFEAKGRFRESMVEVPTQAIMNPEPGLIGAAALAVVESGGSLLPHVD